MSRWKLGKKVVVDRGRERRHRRGPHRAGVSAPRRSRSPIAGPAMKCLPSRKRSKRRSTKGIRIEYLTAPTPTDRRKTGASAAMECCRMELGDPDESGVRDPCLIPGSEFRIEADMIIPAISQSAGPLFPLRQGRDPEHPLGEGSKPIRSPWKPASRASLRAATRSRGRRPTSTPWQPAGRRPSPSTVS